MTETETLQVEVLRLKVQVQQLQAQVMGCQEQTLQSDYKDALAALNSKVETVKKTHNYGDDVTYNFATGQLERKPAQK